ncbi:M23 family metallopeptidase, partial [Xanthomonas campestris]
MLRAAVSAVILLLCIPAAPVAAQQRWHWPGAAAVGATPPASASQRAETAAAPGPALQLEWQAPVYLAWAVNPLDGPAEVRLSAPPSADYRAVPQLPLVQSLGARERRLLARVYPVSQRRTLDGLGLRLEVVPGDPQAQLQEARYQLPFRDVPIQVDQGYGGQYSHSDDPNWYAIDFALPANTPVLAARDGVVMEIQQGAEEAGPHGPD